MLRYENLSSQAYAHVFPVNFFAYCVKNTSMPAHFCLVCVKIVLGNLHTYLVKTGSKKIRTHAHFLMCMGFKALSAS